MSRDDSALLVIDVQQRLIERIHDWQRVVWNIARLLDGAHVLGLPAAATEQYPEKLGTTVSPLSDKLSDPASKLTFSCSSCSDIFEGWAQQGIHKILLAGIESHVCVQQTAFDLLSNGFDVYLAVDATSSRFETDREIAVRRMDSAGVTITTTESILFEWCEIAGTPEFKQISQIVQQTPP